MDHENGFLTRGVIYGTSFNYMQGFKLNIDAHRRVFMNIDKIGLVDLVRTGSNSYFGKKCNKNI
jgi:hypothetical protein